MKMRLKDGKKKVLTLSYDGGVLEDIRLVEILNKYSLKATFNINSGTYFPEDAEHEEFKGRMKLSEEKALFLNSGHEVAVHTLTHPRLELLDPSEIIYEVTEDRKAIEKNYGTIIRGMAYPYGTYNDKVIKVLENCQIAYARTTISTHYCLFPENWLAFHPTCHQNDEQLMELAKKFVEKENRWAEIFSLWGHSWEFRCNDNWEVIEEFAKYMGGNDKIWYATNIEVYDYVQAYERLQTSYDKKIIYNPSAMDVWIEIEGEVYCLKAGETLTL